MDITESYRAAHEPLAQTMATLSSQDWAGPSPCEGWTATDVVRHLIETQRSFLTGLGIEPPAAGPVDEDPAGAWDRHASGMLALLADPAVAGIAYDGMFGPSTLAETLETFYVFDMVAHRWDIARAAGRDTVFSDAELDRLESAAAAFGEHLYLDGICKPGPPPPADASRQTRLLSLLGRAA